MILEIKKTEIKKFPFLKLKILFNYFAAAKSAATASQLITLKNELI